MKKVIPVLFIGLLTVIFFWQYSIKGLLPIPADTIIGLYHPFRDLYERDYPNGIPFKNFLITDPVRQQYPWRKLAISIEKKRELPLWNPYNFAGTPLLANYQSAPFYFFNILFFIMPFVTSWGLIIFLEPLLAGIFLFFYLDNLRLNKWPCLLGAITFSFSGFFVAWMEWGTILHVALWLPLILLAIDKIFQYFKLLKISNIIRQLTDQISNKQIKNKKLFLWSIVFIFSLVSSFFAGHLQTFFYLFIVSWVYFFARWIQYGKIFNILFVFLIFNILFLILTSIQWLPSIQFIILSARNIDQVGFNNPGWFIPWQHLIQFVAPDFFGNPATLNYWGVWNYGEFIGYVGIAPLIIAIFALFFRHDKKTLFFGTIFFVSLLFSLPTIFAKLPYLLSIPFISTAQPTRLLFLTDFSLAVLATLGFDYFLKLKSKKVILYPLGFITIVLVGFWGVIILGNWIQTGISQENLSVAKSNLRLPTTIFTFTFFAFAWLVKFSNRRRKITLILYCIIVIIAVADLLRFGWKFSPFTNKDYLFPNTKVTSFLQKQEGQFRIMTTDPRILPPNFSVIYRLQSVDGYDPLYLRRYSELIAASERGEPNISPSFGFNRIITPHNYESKIIDLLGVKYILSLSDLKSEKLKKVFQEGQTQVYENKSAMPRVFFVERAIKASGKSEAIKMMFRKDFDFRKVAVVETSHDSLGVLSNPHPRWTVGEVKIVNYSENKVIIETKNAGEGFLVLTDSFYPTWKAKIDNTPIPIYRTDYNFRGINVSKGNHTVEFYITLL